MSEKTSKNRPARKPPKTRLDEAERITAAKMHDAGTSKAEIARTLGRSVPAVSRAIADARSILEGNASEYARLHLAAAKVAARKGRGAPMEFALERLGVVEPAKGQADQGPRFTVRIGVMLPGLPALPATSQGNHAAITVDAETLDDET